MGSKTFPRVIYNHQEEEDDDDDDEDEEEEVGLHCLLML
jgi:hypothetical protein